MWRGFQGHLWVLVRREGQGDKVDRWGCEVEAIPGRWWWYGFGRESSGRVVWSNSLTPVFIKGGLGWIGSWARSGDGLVFVAWVGLGIGL
jgi:hypothetical protein